MTRKISVQIENNLERDWFHSLLDIMLPRLNCDWESVIPEEAEVVIIDTIEPDSQYFINACKSTSSALPVAYGSQNYFNTQWYLKRPLNVKQLVSLLNQVDDYLNVVSNDKTLKTTDSIAIEATEVDSIAMQIKSLMQKAKDLPCFCISLEHTPFIYCSQDPVQAILSKEIMQWKTLTTNEPLKSGKLQYNPIKKYEFDDHAVQQEALLMTPKELDWFLFAFFSQGKLRPELNANTVFQLKNWPNFARLPHTPIHVMLCATLMKSPQSVNNLIKNSGGDEAVIVSFINACASQDLLFNRGEEEVNEVADAVMKKRPPVVNKIIRRLFG